MIGDVDDIFSRLKAKLPSRWFGGVADSMPVIDAVLGGLASLISFAYSVYAYAQLQTRILTATDGWLDMIAADFFGPAGLVRKTGQSDASYRVVILANLFREKATRNAVVSILTALTGRAPTIIEPTRPADTGAYGNNRRATLNGATFFATDWQGHQRLSAAPRTNLASMSSVIGDASTWQAVSLTIATNAGIAPDGTTRGTMLSGNTSVSARVQTLSAKLIVVTVGNQYWCRVRLAAGTSTSSRINIYDTNITATQAFVSINWSGGVPSVGQLGGTAGDAAIVATSQGYYELTFSFVPSDNCRLLLYPATATTGQTLWCFGFEILDTVPGRYIDTGASAVTVTDYALPGSGIVSLGPVPAVGVPVSMISPGDGIAQEVTVFTGDGVTASFSVSAPTGPYAPIGYGVKGAYGSLVLPYQAFVIAYRPVSTAGIANVAGYRISTGGYGVPSRAEYASMTMVTGGVSDADIFAAIDAVKPAGTIVWTRISN